MRGVRGRGGFTLIEVVTVMVVIVILAAIAIPRLLLTREKAYRNTIMADLRNLAAMQSVYQADRMNFATTLEELEMTTSRAVTIEITEAGANGWAATATHSSLAIGGCGIFYGNAAPANGAPALTPGVVTCDFSGP